MRLASLFALACLTLTGCGTSAGPLPTATGVQSQALAARGDTAKITSAQAREALTLIGERLYGKDFTFDFQHNDSAIAKKSRNNQGNHDWLVARDFRATEKAGQFAFLCTEYTKDDQGTMQSQYKVTGVVDVKANAVVEIKKEVEDRDPR